MQEYLRSFARRVGKPLSKTQKHLLEEEFEKYSFAKMDIKTNKNVILEIGFGHGDYIFQQAKNHPDKIFIGCEPYMNGVAKLLEKIDIDNTDIKNIFIWNDDARILLDNLPEKFLEQVYILFPDPWPKKKQQKRRLINSYLLDSIYPKLKKNAVVKVATDDEDYANYIKLTFLEHPKYLWLPQENIHKPFDDTIKTHYQKKALDKEVQPYFLEFFCK